MTETAVRGLIEEFETQLNEARARARALQLIVDNLKELAATPAPDLTTVLTLRVEGPRPRGADAVRSVMYERRGLWSRRQVHDAIAERGWQPSDDVRKTANAIDAALHRLTKAREIVRVGDGYYRVPEPATAEAA